MHRRFTLTRMRRAVCSLLRYLSGHPGRMLSAIVLCGARKFLSRIGRGHRGVTTTIVYARIGYSTMSQRFPTPVSELASHCSVFGYNETYPDGEDAVRDNPHTAGNTA